MTTQTPAVPGTLIEYPDNDGQPMSDNTLQFQWIVTIKTNLDALYSNDANVFVAGDLLWYPVVGQPTIRTAPDTLVAFGRPKGYRGSYMQWLEGGIPPQVVFEILSPGNTREEMDRKQGFYERHGVEEYYLYDPDHVRLFGWRRIGPRLQPIPVMDGWVSPRLGIRFDVSGSELVIYRPDGGRFLTFVELKEQEEQARLAAEQERQRADQERQRADQERQRAEQESQRADQEKQRADQEKQRADQERLTREEAQRRVERLAERLRSLGIDPEATP